jgi:hypothetical protein
MSMQAPFSVRVEPWAWSSVYTSDGLVVQVALALRTYLRPIVALHRDYGIESSAGTIPPLFNAGGKQV